MVVQCDSKKADPSTSYKYIQLSQNYDHKKENILKHEAQITRQKVTQKGVNVEEGP